MLRTEDFTRAHSLASAAMESGQHQLARAHLIQILDRPLGFLQLTKTNNLIKRLPAPAPAANAKPIRFAILASSTTVHLKEALENNARLRGWAATFYESPFDSIEQEVLNPQSGLYAFNPTHALILLSDRDTDFLLAPKECGGPAKAALEKTWGDLNNLWDTLRENLPNAQLMQSTLAIRPQRPLGHLESKIEWSIASLTDSLNARIRRSPKISVLDTEYLSAVLGKARWFDQRLWFHSKHAFSMDALSTVSAEITRMLGAMLGASKKCLVLDLDNTLWGGVIGDDGLEGIHLGETVNGEAFVDFQKYVKNLKARGVVLAVCSKNAEENALLPFLRHPHMVLKREDISLFVANWENKADNIRGIAGALNLGLDSLVFFDDNPAERKIVQDLVPEVYTVDVPADPSDYVHALDSLGLFDVSHISEEDADRTQQYLANAERQTLRQKSTDLNEYLRSLEMKCFVATPDASTGKRALQLINKSNQFNLCTNRYSDSEFDALLARPGVYCRTLRLVDAFGDNGIVCVLVLEKTANRELAIRDWVMSCRVLSRGLEDFTLNQICAVARETGCESVIGSYKETSKNGLVANLLPRLGFGCTAKDGPSAHYQKSLVDSKDLPVHILGIYEH